MQFIIWLNICITHFLSCSKTLFLKVFTVNLIYFSRLLEQFSQDQAIEDTLRALDNSLSDEQIEVVSYIKVIINDLFSNTFTFDAFHLKIIMVLNVIMSVFLYMLETDW